QQINLLTGHTHFVYDIAISPNGRILASASWDNTARLWNLDNGQPIASSLQHANWVQCVSFSTDGKLLATGCNDNNAYTWDVPTILREAGLDELLTFEGHTAPVNKIIHLRGAQRIMTCCEDGSLRMWNLKSGEQIGKDWRDGESVVNAIALSPDGKQLASGSKDGAVRLWNIDTGKVITKWTGHFWEVRSVRWNQDGGRVLSGSWDGRARVWDVESGETILAIEQINVFTGHAATVLDIAISPNGRILASASWDNTARLWNLDNGQPIASPLRHAKEAHCVSFLTDGKLLATGCDDNNVYTWD
ncbi:WD40 repeat-like protein, partial [Rhizopogon vinicolor AM-OR11-026]